MSNDNIHTIVWTSKSKDVPPGLNEIINEIKNSAHGIKMIKQYMIFINNNLRHN
jgi:hypothetical protein